MHREPEMPGIQLPPRGGARRVYAVPKARLSELTFVRDDAERDLVGPVFGPVGAKIDFQIHRFAQGQVAAVQFSQAFDGPRPF